MTFDSEFFDDPTARYVLIALIAISLVALWPTWITFQRLRFSQRYLLLISLMLVVCAGMVALGVWLPFRVWSNQNGVAQLDFLIDFVLMGVMPFVILALAAYVIDHLTDKPSAAVLVTAGCLATAIMPIGFAIAAAGPLKVPCKIEFNVVEASTDGKTQGQQEEPAPELMREDKAKDDSRFVARCLWT